MYMDDISFDAPVGMFPTHLIIAVKAFYTFIIDTLLQMSDHCYISTLKLLTLKVRKFKLEFLQRC